MLDKLIIKNRNVRQVFNSISESNKLSRIVDKDKYDEVLDDDKYSKYIIEKKLK